MRTEQVGEITLASDYWECNCDTNFVHPKCRELSCSKCNKTEDDSPDARLEDVRHQTHR